jgi:hypothetical protein
MAQKGRVENVVLLFPRTYISQFTFFSKKHNVHLQPLSSNGLLFFAEQH